jgi:hypothetical protein
MASNTNHSSDAHEEDPAAILSGVDSNDISKGEDEKIKQDKDTSSSNGKPTEDEKRFLAEKNLPSNQTVQEEQQQEQTFTQKDIFNQLPETIRQQLDNCTGWAITKFTKFNLPQKFIIAKKDFNQILNAEIKKQKSEKGFCYNRISNGSSSSSNTTEQPVGEKP